MPNPIVRITVDSDTYDVDLSDLTGIDAKDFRRAVGIPLAAVLTEKTELDLDVVAGLVWLARRRNEPSLTFEKVAAGINFLSDLDIDQVEEEVGDPEA